MPQIASASFLATVQSVIVLDRQLTQAELATLGAIKQTAISNGQEVSPNNITIIQNDTGETYTYTTFYNNADTANACVNAANGFTPAPTSATVVNL